MCFYRLSSVFTLLFICFSLHSQKIFSVKYASQADVKVFVVDYESQADLLVHKKEYSSQSSGNKGDWFFVDYESQAKKKIFFVSVDGHLLKEPPLNLEFHILL